MHNHKKQRQKGNDTVQLQIELELVEKRNDFQRRAMKAGGQLGHLHWHAAIFQNITFWRGKKKKKKQHLRKMSFSLMVPRHKSGQNSSLVVPCKAVKILQWFPAHFSAPIRPDIILRVDILTPTTIRSTREGWNISMAGFPSLNGNERKKIYTLSFLPSNKINVLYMVKTRPPSERSVYI